MRTVRIGVLLTLCLSAAALAGATPQEPALAGGKLRLAERDGVPHRYIVVLADETTDHRGRPQLSRRGLAERESLITELALTHGAAVRSIWLRALPGFSARLSPDQAHSLAADPRVLLVEQVMTGQLSPAYSECPAATHEAALAAVISGANQVINCANPVPGQDTCRDNWGLDRIDQANLGTGNPPALSGTYRLPTAGATVHAYVLDTGITLGHREFRNAQGTSRIGSGVNVTVDPLGAQHTNVTDVLGNSHGTHVSAILGGSTYGVAKNVILHPVRVTTNNSIPTDRVIDGIEWILDNHPPGQGGVANLSANGTSYSTSIALALAVRRLLQGGVALVESAGNQNGQVATYAMVGGFYPSEVILAGGSSRLDKRWARPASDPFCVNPTSSNNCASNFGPEIDLFAPAENILSASNKPNDLACFLTGTSMAAPHVTGAAAALLARFPDASPGAVEEALIRIASLNKLDPATLNGSPNRLLYTVFPASGAPVAGNDLFSTPAGTALTLPTAELLAGDFDWAGGALTFVSAGSAMNGTVSVSGSNVTFTPTAGFSGEGRFVYTIRNPAGQQDTAIVRIQVGTLPLPPVAVDDALATAAGTALQFTAGTLLANDLDPDSTFQFHRFVTLPAHGVLEQVSGSTWRYVPDAGFSGIDRFTYRIRDSNWLSDIGTVDVRVGGPFGGALLLDRFTNVSPLRDPGDPLNGTRTEVGNFLWTAASGAGLGSGILTNPATTGSVIGGVPVQPGSHPTASAGRLEARIDSRAPGWTGVGFSLSATGGYWSHGQVWAYLRTNGRLQVAANGTTHNLYTSTTPAPGFVIGWNTLTLEYDWTEKSVRVWLNGQPQPLAISDLDDVGFQPNIQYAGFHAHPDAASYPAAQQVGIDDFALTLFHESSRPEMPINVAASDDGFGDRVRITWTAVPGATGYRIYRHKSATISTPDLLPQQVSGTSFEDRTAKPGTTHHYWVQAVNASGLSPLSSSDAGRRRNEGQILRTYSAAADATARQNAPSSNFGSEALLGIRNPATGQGRFSFLRFDLTGIDGTVESAELEIRPNAQLPGASVYLVDDMYWNESTLNWDNWGSCATAVFLWKSWDLKPPTGESDRLSFDITDAVRGNGSVTIGLTSDFDQAGMNFVSRENGAVPWRPAVNVYFRGSTPQRFLLEPTADARVSQPQPGSNFGTQNFLRVRTQDFGSGEHSYLKFSIPGSGGTVQSANLRLRTQETSIARIDAYRVGTTSWTETGITWNNAPVDTTGHLGFALNLPGNAWVDVPMSTGAGGINTRGVHTVGVVTGANLANLDFWSRDSSCRPRLDVVVSP